MNTVPFVITIIVIAFIFDFSNGFHDSANSVAMVVSTRVMSPGFAVVWAALFNFVGLFLFGTAVAKTFGKGLVELSVVDPQVVFAGLIGAIAWNLITWYFGIPSSSSHALTGGYAGAAITKAGFGALVPGAGWIKLLSFIVISPMIGFLFGLTLMTIVGWTFRKVHPRNVDRWFRGFQIISSSALSLSHGTNDSQKTMGIVVGLLFSTQVAFAHHPWHFLHLTSVDNIPFWVEAWAYGAIALGTLFGGWRIVKTMGQRITRITPYGGFCADTGSALAILLASHYGIPVSTTHTITGSVSGVGAAQRIKSVRWGVAREIVWAWILTIPAAAILAALVYLPLRAWGY